MADCYSIRACKTDKYIVAVDGDTVKFGSEKNRLLFYDENEAENYQALCDDTMDDCFQIMVEKESNEHLIERIMVSDCNKPYGVPCENSDSALWKIIMNLDTDCYFIAHQLFKIYQETTDKKSFKEMFEVIFGISFEEYLKKCEATIDN